MPSHCSAHLCLNNSSKKECREKKITFHPFPLKNELLLQFWLIQMRKADFIPSASSKLCSEHFEEDCFYYEKESGRKIIHPDAVPTKFTFTQEEEENICSVPTVLHIREVKRRKLTVEDFEASPDSPLQQSSSESQDNFEEASTAEISTQFTTFPNSSEKCSSFPLLVFKKDAEVQTKMDGISALLVENTVLQGELVELKNHVNRLTFCAEAITDDTLMKTLTGYSIELLKAVYVYLDIESQLNAYVSLSPFNQFFMFLMYLRTGISQLFLSLLFKISQATVSRISNNVSHLLYAKTKAINIWPTRDQINSRSPPAFLKNYPNCRVILENVEFQIQRPTSTQTQRLTFSPRKNAYTVRALVGKTPTGGISFVSDMWPGSISDKDLFLKSGILDYLDEYDVVLADRNFDIKDEVEYVGCQLVTQKFLTDRIFFTEEEKKNYEAGLTHHRIHYDLASSKFNKYKFFETQITSMTFDIVNEYFYIVAFLINFDKPLLYIKQH